MANEGDNKPVVFSQSFAERVNAVVREAEAMNSDVSGARSKTLSFSRPMRYGKITALSDPTKCSLKTVTVSRVDVFGNDLGGDSVTLGTVNPTSANGAGFDLDVGDIVAFLPATDTTGLLIGPYKQVGVGYYCTGAMTRDDLWKLYFHDFDFTLTAKGCSHALVEWNGLIVSDGYTSASYDAVKEIGFDNADTPPSGEDAIPVYFSISSSQEAYPMSPNCESYEYQKVTIEAAVSKAELEDMIDKLKVYDCNDTEYADTTSIKFGDGLAVSGAAGAVEVELNLTAGDNLEIVPGTGACEEKINWLGMTAWQNGDPGTLENTTKVIDFRDGFSVTSPAAGTAEIKSAACSTANPTTLGDATEGSEAADTTTWGLGDGTPLELWVMSRGGFFHGGDKKLYGYARKLTFDKCGKLNSVSGETRYEIDAPEDCP